METTRSGGSRSSGSSALSRCHPGNPSRSSVTVLDLPVLSWTTIQTNTSWKYSPGLTQSLISDAPSGIASGSMEPTGLSAVISSDRLFSEKSSLNQESKVSDSMPM